MDINGYLLYFVYVFSSIFVIVNPIEATMVYVTLTCGLDSQEKDHIDKRTTLVAFTIAILFAFAGDAVLRIFGITVDSLRVAGGVLLFLVAIDMLRGVRRKRRSRKQSSRMPITGRTSRSFPWPCRSLPVLGPSPPWLC